MTIAEVNDILFGWFLALENLWDLFTTPIVDLVGKYLPTNFYANVIRGFLLLTDNSGLTLLGFMLGSGILLYVVYQFIVWVLNLLT